MFEEIEHSITEFGLAAPSESDVTGRRWTTIVDKYDTIARWRVFGVLSDHITDAEYGETVRHIWTHSEGDFDEGQFDAVFLTHGRQIDRNCFMTDAEKDHLSQMPDPVTVYRGCQNDTRDGVCWSVDLDCARGFAQRAAGESLSGEGLVLVGECSKADVLAYFNADGLHEWEILTKQVSKARVLETVISQDDD